MDTPESADPDGVRLTMVRRTLDHLPRHPLPPGYTFASYAAGDERHWVAIHKRADRHNSGFADRFVAAFGADADALRARQVYLRDARGGVVGTATAWYDLTDPDADGMPGGRVHWVAVEPVHQGLGLGKSLLSWVLARLTALGHRRAVLSTSSARVAAVGLYRQFGFAPMVRAAAERAAWDALASHVRPPHPVLTGETAVSTRPGSAT